MRFLIDGYNLLYAVWPGEMRLVRPRAWPRLRQRLLDRLDSRFGNDARSSTVVFDAAHPPTDAPAEADSRRLHVRFAVGYPSADDLIEDLIRTDSAPAGLTVVSDDRRLRDAARRRGCVVRGCLDFFEQIERPPVPEPPAEEPPTKPDAVTPADVDYWLKEFGGPGGDG